MKDLFYQSDRLTAQDRLRGFLNKWNVICLRNNLHFMIRRHRFKVMALNTQNINIIFLVFVKAEHITKR